MLGKSCKNVSKLSEIWMAVNPEQQIKTQKKFAKSPNMTQGLKYIKLNKI